MKRLASAFIFLLLLMPYAFAADVTVTAEASKSNVTIGEPIECKITVRYPEGVEILNGIPTPEAAGLDFKKASDWQDKEGKTLLLGRTITFVSFQLGNYLIEPIQVSYKTREGKVESAKSKPVYIEVKSIAEGEEKTDIRDVKGVVKLPYWFTRYVLPAAAALILGGLLAAYLLYFRKKELERLSRIPKLTPAQQALRDLHELFESTLLRDGQVKQYYLRFSEILRVFLEKQFGIQAVEATTSEIKAIMRRVTATDEAKQQLITVLEAADFAKFAKWVPPPADVLALNKQAEALVVTLSSQPTETSHAVS